MNCKNEIIYFAALFPSISHVMKAEKILIAENFPFKIIPVPKVISSDCGVCIRFNSEMLEQIKLILDQNFEDIEYRSL